MLLINYNPISLKMPALFEPILANDLCRPSRLAFYPDSISISPVSSFESDCQNST